MNIYIIFASIFAGFALACAFMAGVEVQKGKPWVMSQESKDFWSKKGDPNDVSSSWYGYPEEMQEALNKKTANVYGAYLGRKK